jgi:hypothetical protein
MKSIILILLLIVSQYAQASWLCREASSQAEGDHFYSCGVAQSSTLYQARKQSLLNAKQEFRAFCNESSHCRNKEYIISPMRTDCSKKDDLFICYRGLDYQILDEERSFKNMNLDEIKDEIKLKEENLNKLEEKHRNLKHLKQLNDNINDFNKMDKLEVELERLDEVKSNIQKKSNGKAGLQFVYINLPLPYGNQNMFGIGPEYERFIYGDTFGVKFNLNYIMSTDSKPDINKRGTANSTSSPDYHSHKGLEFSISLPIHIRDVTIGPKFGYTSVKYKSTTEIYNSSGVALNTESITQKFNDQYLGLSLRYGRSYYIEIEPRKYIKSDKSNMSIGIGVSIPF